MTPGRIVALVIGCVLALPGVGLVVGGSSLGIALATQRDDGFLDVPLDRIATDEHAVVADDVAFDAEPGAARWALGLVDADVRIRVTTARDADDAFVGVARSIDVDAYLDDVGHDRVTGLDDGRTARLEASSGERRPVRPPDMVIWAASASGPGTIEVVWPAQSGRWSVVLMNADGSPGVAADVEVGLRLGFLAPLAIGMLLVGLVVCGAAATLIVAAVRRRPLGGPSEHSGGGPVLGPPPPVPSGQPLPPPAPPGLRPSIPPRPSEEDRP